MIYLNFLPIKTGGGLQNALSFIKGCKQYQAMKAIVVRGSDIELVCQRQGLETISIRDGKLSRVFFEIVLARRCLARQCTVFTLFGTPFWFLSKNQIQINGFAYSNILYPEIRFWSYLPFGKKLVKRVVDMYRYWSFLWCDEVVFETDIMERRASRRFVFARKRRHVVRMSPSRNVPVLTQDLSPAGRGHRVRILYLTGSHPNKRIHLLPAFIKECVDLNMEVEVFVTCDLDSYTRSIRDRAKELGVEDRLNWFGSVRQENVVDVIDTVDAVINIAKLESFSNNVVEAWARGRILIISDEDWARDACADAAIYINPEEPREAAEIVLKALASHRGELLVKKGFDRLRQYPTPDERTRQFNSIISVRSGV